MIEFLRRPWVIAIGVIILAIVIGFVVWFVQRPSLVVLTPNQVGAVLLQHAKVSIPPVATSTDIKATQLPTFARMLILSDATEVSARAVQYAGSKLGYEISYNEAMSVGDSYVSLRDILKNGKWSFAQGGRALAFAYIVFSGNGLTARAEFTALAPSSTAVVIHLIQP